MSFFVENKILFRKLGMAMFVISMLGPWAFDRLSVPAQFACTAPAVRLYGDFCGYPMSGFGGFLWASGSFFRIIDGLIKGYLATLIPELITFVSTRIIVLPFFSMLMLIWKPNSRRLQTLHLIVWGLACLAALTIFIPQSNMNHFMQFFYRLWGILLYVMSAIGAVIFEILILRSKPSLSRKTKELK